LVILVRLRQFLELCDPLNFWPKAEPEMDRSSDLNLITNLANRILLCLLCAGHTFAGAGMGASWVELAGQRSESMSVSGYPSISNRSARFSGRYVFGQLTLDSRSTTLVVTKVIFAYVFFMPLVICVALSD